MKLLFVENFPPDPNTGAAGSTLAIIAELRKSGHEVEYLSKSVEPYIFPHPQLQQLIELPKRQQRQVEEQLQRKSYDVVIASQPYAYRIYENLAPRYPHTAFLNRTHGWEERLINAEQQYQWRERSGLPGRVLTAMSRAVTRRFCRRSARGSHGVIAACRLCADFVVNTYGIPPERVVSIPHGLSVPYLITPPTRKVGEPAKLFFTGQYLARKGSHYLREILPRIARDYPGVTVTFVVPQESVDLVRRDYSEAFGARLNASPWMKRDALIALYGSHDIFLFPSLFEGFGMTFLEAMSMGMCVVAFKEGGVADILTSERELLSVETGNVMGFEQELRWAIENPAAAAQMGCRALARARQFTWVRTAKHMERFCDRVSTARH